MPTASSSEVVGDEGTGHGVDALFGRYMAVAVGAGAGQ
jgi:hypothetical protein